MIWCIRHKFLENVEPRYPNSVSWSLHVSERKLAAIERTWPNLTGYTAETGIQHESTLFIEDALSNLQIEQDFEGAVSGELDVRSLLGDAYRLSDLSEMVGVSGLYPFKDLRSAADILFLHGTSDMVVAKQAIVSLKNCFVFTWFCIVNLHLHMFALIPCSFCTICLTDIGLHLKLAGGILLMILPLPSGYINSRCWNH